MIKKIFLAAGLFFLASISRAETVSFFNIPFKSVDFYITSTASQVWFKSVVINEELKDVEVNVDAIEIELKADLKIGDFIITTLDILNVPKDFFNNSWLKPKKVIVLVRTQFDMDVWKEFLLNIKKKQEIKRKQLLEPIRVCPPIIEVEN